MVTKHDLVCTKEQAMKLKYKEVRQSSIFACTETRDNYGMINVLDDNFGDGYAAYTTAEMVDLLPKMSRIKYFLFVWRTKLNPVKVADYLIRIL